MAFESHGGESFSAVSPGGFEFGVVGFIWGPPVPKSITFYLDNTAMICDQYGRQIRRALTADGREVRFADTPPDASKEGDVTPRPQFATHAQVIEVLAAERVDWLSYEVRYRARDGSNRVHANLTLTEAVKLQERLLQEGNNLTSLGRTIVCAGWPQLPYDDLKKLPELPPTPREELEKIRDPKIRKDALRVKAEVMAAREKELAAMREE